MSLDNIYEQASERVYGMPYSDCKKKFQSEASPEQAKAFDEGQGVN